ncbi:acyl-CoA carboxylase epsilon subunit [Actinokineospora bangkokensis]|uniref:Acetyl-CoA carboxylase biotin carboxyl carrier protein subunit n=1 Tax=Actinokineospora bangkokensis TaxID=1193682 RepID=A0A1Q9LEL0_9PSEU|nr:acyl-CoA carboxylase epsilon subunit [Actinokineospora bangkokensis]OLR90468.1 acetyl-CoA carboxylase biotin carboxyl carrier protein subunit [Actinokineospora bangkokensis]
MPEQNEPASPALLHVVRGNPDDVELAALTAVVAAAATTGGEPEQPTEGGGWADKAAQVRAPLPHGPGAWRASARPR